MKAPGTPSVDQLLVLLTVVEEEGFTGAARRLRRATSAIGYAIDTLEAQLGVTLCGGPHGADGRVRNARPKN
jgi:DNA-binding transcriptional LysR family regulator